MTDIATATRIRRISGEDGPLLRSLRLRALTDSPFAFGQTVDEASERTAAEWQRSATQGAQGDERAWFIAEHDGHAVGLVQGRHRGQRTLLLFSMWVDPAARHRGIGRLLVAALESWASSWGATETILWALRANPAIRFYESLGFAVISVGDDADSGARHGAIALRRAVLISDEPG